MLKNRLEDQDSHKIEKLLKEKPRSHLYNKGYILIYRIQIWVKLILDETWLKDESNHINYTSLDLRWRSYDF